MWTLDACRGGIQIAFPTFNKSRELPQNGFMDKMQWSLADSSIGPTSAEDPAPHVTFVTRSNEQTMKLWPHQFEASYSVSCLALIPEQAILLQCCHQAKQETVAS